MSVSERCLSDRDVCLGGISVWERCLSDSDTIWKKCLSNRNLQLSKVSVWKRCPFRRGIPISDQSYLKSVVCLGEVYIWEGQLFDLQRVDCRPILSCLYLYLFRMLIVGLFICSSDSHWKCMKWLNSVTDLPWWSLQTPNYFVNG